MRRRILGYLAWPSSGVLAPTMTEQLCQSPNWTRRPRRFRLQLGELPLGTVNLPAMVSDAHFTSWIGHDADPGLPLAHFPDGVDVVVIQSYPVETPLPRIRHQTNAIRYSPNHYRHFYIALEGTFDEYLAKFSSKSRANLRKKMRRYADLCSEDVRCKVARTQGELEEFHRAAHSLSDRTYQSRLLGAGLPDRDAFLRLTSSSEARGYLLCHGQRPVAYIFSPIRDGHVMYDFVGHDPEYAEWSPGTILQYLALESLFAEGRFRTFDFTEGEGKHKEFFANRSIPCADLYFFRPGVKCGMLVYGLASLRTSSRWAASALETTGLKGRVKKFLRSLG
jgi:CelD/BcsL family acetyltransferase involved in cellulose biosynthesis